MKLLLRSIIKILGKVGLIDRYFYLGTKIAIILLPKEWKIKVGRYEMLINPKEDLGLYFGYEDVEPDVVFLFQREIKECDVFFDVGAYKGYYSLMVSQLVGEKGKVVAFEPSTKAFEILIRNTKINHISNIVAEECCISDFEGESSFVICEIGGYMDSSGNQSVKVKTMDKIVNSMNLIPSIVKIDVEGAEYSVLKGGMDTLTRFHPKLLIEVHTPVDFRVFDLLNALGYNIGLVRNDGKVFYNNLDEIKKKCEERQWTKYGTRMNRHIYCKK